METSYHIRLATRADLDGLNDVERAAARLFPPGRIPDPDDVVPMRALERAADRQSLHVASLEEEVVGFAVSEEHDGCLHLAEVAVHPDHGRRGVGTRLVSAVIELARSRGLAGVTLTTFRDLPWNAPFYARLGFRILDEAELSPRLRATLAREARLGMTGRVAMLYSMVD